ncbi:hypothetical protein JG687_00011109 [Phytophthora cactorum]|uniref:Uncharacterized protein n=1 Tax=Phytophthora cactorum TaxID=29920 RepID=A0A8T1UAI7_9STRA|nr:hypothetical protein JG687_00011109 [Phytophthora cactorum]
MTSSPSSIKEQGAEDSSSLNDCVLYPPNRHLLSEHVIGGVVQRSRTLRRSYAAQSFVGPRPGASYFSYTRQWPREQGETEPRSRHWETTTSLAESQTFRQPEIATLQ